ncbi:uncharacterized protein PADG_01902 [Paracoccidioides brasiliensis Pb18]|uniref:Uncharacterized protein n=1 Tax=Paracoccidioides brasiliensis (strain Pb18) TaxID=502780 RepID=C1G4N6_PARBD|nr:uncharacterized protein PADG_01902 [Paracoccidioides brasiliensis Pb18]EEH45752.2 hypothetical protein PADG_01902 [Paracoccidioides brasiliensis Pb18]
MATIPRLYIINIHQSKVDRLKQSSPLQISPMSSKGTSWDLGTSLSVDRGMWIRGTIGNSLPASILNCLFVI